MLVTTRVNDALLAERDALQSAAERTGDAVDSYRDAVARVRRLTRQQITAELGGVPWPGARPTNEYDQRGLLVPFGVSWETAEAAREWALPVLRDVPTIAVDGSQIAASKEFGVPISLVQIAWFENYHSPVRPYVKDVLNRIVGSGGHADESEEYVFAESRLNQCRFVLEMQSAAERVRQLPAGQFSVVFIDGTFVLSFASRMRPEIRTVYLDALFQLLDVSREQRIPVVGFVDLSYASDLMLMVRQVCDLPRAAVFDSQVLRSSMNVFDRTAAFQCAREDVLPFYGEGVRDWSEDIYFLYLQTGVNRPPARIDVPSWVVDDGLLDRVIDVVRAEIVVGSGYPYALETADATAVLTLEDRLTFYGMYHEFARQAGLSATVPAKSISKAHRR